MKENSITDRIVFLAEMFDVFECDDDKVVELKLAEFNNDGYLTEVISNGSGILAIVSKKDNNKERMLKKISVCSEVFSEMIAADPTENKIYLQWMLNLFTRLLKSDKENQKDVAIRFVSEDLPQANKYLTLFEDNKRKRKFKDLCLASYSLKGITDPTNINQYKSLSQLFDAVDPFIEKDSSAIERTLQKFVNAGQALIPVKDRKFTLFIPKTTEASVVFANFANWCTAREGNSMFKSYTENHRKPDGKKSNIYIVIPNSFFEGKTKELFQIHFETNQLKDRQNGQNVSIFENVISESEGLANYFHDELLAMAKEYKGGIDSNKYLDYLMQFGFAESLFELLDDKLPTIRFMSKEIRKLPNINKFTKLDQLIITNAKLGEIHPSIGNLNSLNMLALTNNLLTTLPKEIGYLKNLEFLNIKGNKYIDIPEEISMLDKSNGGSLFRIVVDEQDLGEEKYKRLKELLPTTNFS
jgi:hypothetical protein